MPNDEVGSDLLSQAAAEPGHSDIPENSRANRASFVTAIAVAAGLIAGIASWGAGEIASHAFSPPLERSEVMGRVMMKAKFEDQATADYKNAVLCSALLGAILAASLGLAGGLARNSFPAAWRAGATGFFLGALLGAGSSAVLLPVYFRAEDRAQEALSQDLMIPLLALGGPWAAAGLGGGIALGLGLGRGRVNAMEAGLGGLLGSFLGAVLYLVAGSIAFPASKTAVPFPADWPARLLGALLVTTLAGLLAATLSARRVGEVTTITK